MVNELAEPCGLVYGQNLLAWNEDPCIFAENLQPIFEIVRPESGDVGEQSDVGQFDDLTGNQFEHFE